MLRQTALLVSLVGLFSVFCWSCGPSCPETKTAMSKKELANDDTSRVNELVGRRKTLMEEGTAGASDKFAMERIKFSVTAYELAIQMQLRIIELASSSDLYDANLKEINDTRCLLDELLAPKKINKDDLTVSDGMGKDIQERFSLFKKLFGKEGAVSNYELKEYYQKGIKVETKDVEEDEESMGIDDEGDEGDEEDESEEDESGMDDFLE